MVCRLILPLLLLPARRRGSAGRPNASNSGDVVLLPGIGDAVVAATDGWRGGVTACELAVTPWSGDTDTYC